MTLVVRNRNLNGGYSPHSYFDLGSVVDDILQFDPFARRSFSGGDTQVRTLSHKDRHEVFVSAPGLKKSDFDIQLKGSKLIISYEACCAKENTEDCRTFSKSAFSRSYSVSRDTLPEDVKAKYAAGVLKVTISRPESEVPTEHSIKIN